MIQRFLRVTVAMLLLDASVTFRNIWPTPGIRWTGQLSIELAICLLGIALVRWARPAPMSRRAVAVVAGGWLFLVLGHYAEVTAQALFGRDINLYWDLRFIPDVAAMITKVASAWLIAVCIAGAVLVLALLYVVVRWAWMQVAFALADTRGRQIITALAIALVVLFAWERRQTNFVLNVAAGGDREYVEPPPLRFPSPVTATYLRQMRFIVSALSTATLLPPTPPMNSDLAAVRGADVFLVFIESYGAVSYERREIAEGLASTRASLASAIRDTKRGVVTAYVDSPTFGGSSWLAHVSLLSGIDVRDPERNARIMIERRDTLVREFARHGFRTVALMPGLRQQWPEGSFYGFDEIYGADRLKYRGPEFGWFAIPDQFSLFALDAFEVNRPSRPPLFVFFPTISTHFPFIPTPPYQPDWARMRDARPYDGPEIVRAYAREPDWTHFGPGYVAAMSYDLTSIAGYLRLHADRDLVMILIGDHQPAAAVTGLGASWSVPVHVIANRPGVLGRLAAAGFQPGLAPSRPAIARMHALGPILLDAFGRRDGQARPEDVRSEKAR
jgi:hypothetical protein